MIFQAIVIPYSLWTLAATFVVRHQRKIGRRYFLLLAVSHLAILFVTLFPNATYPLANLAGVGRGADFVLYFAIIILLRVLFYLYNKNRLIETQLTKIVRHLALQDKRD